MQVDLVPARPDDAALFRRWRTDPEARRFNPLLPEGRESAAQLIARFEHDLVTRFRAAASFRWVIAADGARVGHATLRDIDRALRVAEIGYWVDAPHRRRGIGAAAVAHLAERAFRETPLRRLIACVHAGNVPSQRLLARVGFVQEGVLREHFVVEGVPADQIVYGLLRREWRPAIAARPARGAHLRSMAQHDDPQIPSDPRLERARDAAPSPGRTHPQEAAPAVKTGPRSERAPAVPPPPDEGEYVNDADRPSQEPQEDAFLGGPRIEPSGERR